jgi:hypothetical protein
MHRSATEAAAVASFDHAVLKRLSQQPRSISSEVTVHPAVSRVCKRALVLTEMCDVSQVRVLYYRCMLAGILEEGEGAVDYAAGGIL